MPHILEQAAGMTLQTKKASWLIEISTGIKNAWSKRSLWTWLKVRLETAIICLNTGEFWRVPELDFE